MAVIFGRLLRVDEPCQPVGIQWTLRCWRTSKHPEHRIGFFDDLVQHLPAIGLCVLIGIGLVHYDQVKAAVDDLVLDDCQPIEVDDDELSASVYHFLAGLSVTMCHAARAVHSEGEQVLLPRRLHDGQGAEHQHTADLVALQQIVRCPDDGCSLTCTLLIEAERPVMERQKRGCGLLVREGLVLASPLVISQDR